MRVAVIGAGPSGLVTLKYLLEAHKALNLIKPIEVRCFESDIGVGGTFLARTYEDAEVQEFSLLFLPCLDFSKWEVGVLNDLENPIIDS